MRLYQLLHQPLAADAAGGHAAREARLRFLAQNDQTRKDVQFLLHEMGRPGTGTLKTLVFENGLLDEKYKVVICVLAVLPFAVFSSAVAVMTPGPAMPRVNAATVAMAPALRRPLLLRLVISRVLLA